MPQERTSEVGVMSRVSQKRRSGLEKATGCRSSCCKKGSMRRVAPHQLWIGHAGDARATRRLCDEGIRAVVQLALEEPIATVPRECVLLRFPLMDGSGNDPGLLELSIMTTVRLLKAQTPTLVCCGAGMSRSPAVAAAALSILETCELEDSLERIAKQGPTDVAPGLWYDVKCAQRRVEEESHTGRP